jgi:hypothetical protein
MSYFCIKTEMKNQPVPYKTLFWVTLFAMAIGFLETSVVVYLRALLYPGGFAFPLAPMSESLALTEILREAATLIIILSIGYITGKNFTTRFAWFLYIFAMWDLFYYVFLKLLLNWPESWLTWDILFLIPTTWVGPVICPVIVSISMIVLAMLILKSDSRHHSAVIHRAEWALLITGSIILILSFTWEYSGFILKRYSFSQIWSIPTKELLVYAQTYIPEKFNWFLFFLGQAIIIAGIWLYGKHNK